MASGIRENLKIQAVDNARFWGQLEKYPVGETVGHVYS